MGAAAAALPNSNTSSINIPLWDSNTSSILKTEHQFYEHQFGKKGSAGGYTRVLSCRPKAK